MDNFSKNEGECLNYLIFMLKILCSFSKIWYKLNNILAIYVVKTTFGNFKKFSVIFWK